MFSTIITDIIDQVTIANKFAITATQSGKWLSKIEKYININKSRNKPQWEMIKEGHGVGICELWWAEKERKYKHMPTTYQNQVPNL